MKLFILEIRDSDDPKAVFGVHMELPDNFSTMDENEFAIHYGNPSFLQLQQELVNRND